MSDSQVCKCIRFALCFAFVLNICAEKKRSTEMLFTSLEDKKQKDQQKKKNKTNSALVEWRNIDIFAHRDESLYEPWSNDRTTNRNQAEAPPGVFYLYANKGFVCGHLIFCLFVLKHDAKNVKALFRRAKAYRHLGLFELALADLNKVQELIGKDSTIEEELKLLKKDERNADKAFYLQMQKAMQKNTELKKKKKSEDDATSTQTNTTDKNSTSLPTEDNGAEKSTDT
ncbi:hypothetical protein RFI_31041 [Reticulomyxa filosa]|uniref:Uncharacterized protein n=1 Tax=Reticulomyxa filosa TaxID=46433 RepID=X6LYF3_RETFI|nr:hypothetical protein RFI_31041 [Reticulomyxa filosa]|eukprot:ETO06361.1 hypothetical protein RFI_31041 [Reticulomyxa filosa]